MRIPGFREILTFLGESVFKADIFEIWIKTFALAGLLNTIVFKSES